MAVLPTMKLLQSAAVTATAVVMEVTTNARAVVGHSHASTAVLKGQCSSFEYRFEVTSCSHSKADCTEPAKPRPCFNCGEEGHTSKECTNERVEREFTGTCRVCEQTGR